MTAKSVQKEIRLSYRIDDIDQTVIQFLSLIGEYKHLAFFGSMGAGKTTFITAICRNLGIKDLVSSPSFAIANEYRTSAGVPVYHLDLYRINTIEELYDIGIEEYCYDDAYCFIEWPDLAREIIADHFLSIYIEVMDDGTRILRFNN